MKTTRVASLESLFMTVNKKSGKTMLSDPILPLFLLILLSKFLSAEGLKTF